MAIKIRPFDKTDTEAITELIKRLAEFEMPPWRTPEMVDGVNIEHIRTAMAELEDEPGSAIYTAEESGTEIVAGFVRLQTRTDYFSGDPVAYVANLTVEKGFEGLGIGKKLMSKAEEWAKEQGFDRIALHVFVENERAQELYRKIGYAEDVRGYVKMLEP